MVDREIPEIKSEDWQVSWEAHRRAQLALTVAASPAQRLAWLEEMLALAYRTGALPRRENESPAVSAPASR